VETKLTVQDLQRLGEQVMKDIRSLSVLGKIWQKPTVHRFLELFYRSLSLIQIPPATATLVLNVGNLWVARPVLLRKPHPTLRSVGMCQMWAGRPATFLADLLSVRPGGDC